jgi:hypothetical protein
VGAGKTVDPQVQGTIQKEIDFIKNKPYNCYKYFNFPKRFQFLEFLT